MRRPLVKFSIALSTAALALGACGTQADNDAGSDDPYECNIEQTDSPQIGLAYDVGGRGDQSFNDAAYAGLEKAVDEFNSEHEEGEAVDDEPESAREDRLRQMADGGANIIVGVGFAYEEAIDEVSPDYPDVAFGVVDGGDPTPDEKNCNVAYLGFAEHEGSFLVGAAAALKTETDKIGYVGGVHTDLIKKFEAGYVAGAKEVNPDIEVMVSYIEEEDLSGFADPAGGQAAATGEFDKGADIVYHAAGGSGAGVFDAAVEADHWAIGVDSDQYKTAAKDQQKHIMTSMIKRVDVATYDFIESLVDGDVLSGEQTYDLAADGVGYSTAGDFIDDITDDLDDYKAKIVDGDIEVPAQP